MDVKGSVYIVLFMKYYYVDHIKEDTIGGSWDNMRMKNEHKIFLRKTEWNDHSEDLDVDMMMILKWILGE